jgi:hypothetical protein
MFLKKTHRKVGFLFIILVMKLFLLIFLFSCAHQHFSNDPYVDQPNYPYRRKDWKHWTDSDKNCLNTRHELLKARSQIKVQYSKKGCTVISGEWKDYYYPEKIFQASKVDVDHVIPLKHAHESGGYLWASDKKEHFANDPDNLVLTNRKYNRQKGAKTIAEWLPVQIDYACKYVANWFRLKRKYRLNVTKEELRTKSLLIDKCQ